MTSDSPIDRDADIAAYMHNLFATEMATPDPRFVAQLELKLSAVAREANEERSSAVKARSRSDQKSASQFTGHRSFELVRWIGLIGLIALISVSSFWFTQRDNAPRRLDDARVESASINWSQSPGQPENPTDIVLAANNDVVVRLGSLVTPSYIEAIDATTGALRWRRDIFASGSGASLGSTLNQAIAIDDHHVYAIEFPSLLVALDVNSGERVWTHELTEGGLTIQSVDGNVFVWQQLNSLTVLDSESGTVKWTLDEVAPASTVLRGPFVTESNVLIVTTPGELDSFNPETGELMWTFAGEFDTLNVTMAVSNDDRGETLFLRGTNVLSPTYDPQTGFLLVAIDAADGSQIWETRLEGGGNFPIVADESVVYVLDLRLQDQIGTPANESEVRGRIYAYDRETGQLVWNSEPGPMPVDLTLSPSGILTAFTVAGQIAVFDAGTHSKLCNVIVPNFYLNERIASGELLLTLQADGTLIAFDPAASCSD